MPVVSGSSHSRHSQKRKEVVGGQVAAKYSGHDQELSSSEKRLVNEHEASHQRMKGQSQAQKSFTKKNKSITI